MSDSTDEEAEQECKSLQQEEYEVLESIYPNCLTNDHQQSRGLLKLEIPVELEEVHTVNIQEDGTLAHQNDEARFQTVNLTTLPPIILDVVLPPLYPLFKPPELLSIRVTHFWLPKVSRLRELLNDMWRPGEGIGILYNWVEFIRAGDFLAALELVAGHNNLIQLSHPVPLVLVSSLRLYENLAKTTEFNNNSYLCSICFMSYKGAKCLQLSCNHRFCRSCLAEYWKLSIAEGEVGKVGCADPECVKEGREARMDEVKCVVTDEEVERWKWLREKRISERDPAIVHCPMTFCQAPVRPTADGGADEGSMWGRFRQCDDCGYTFCKLCRRLWHGPHTACAVGALEEQMMEYLAAAEGSETRRRIEREYGRKAVRKAVHIYEDTKANMTFIEANTTACPQCSMAVEKSGGCNIMTCRRCKTQFCYRCGDKLGRSQPFKHYKIVGSSCYYQLFGGAIE